MTRPARRPVMAPPAPRSACRPHSTFGQRRGLPKRRLVPACCQANSELYLRRSRSPGPGKPALLPCPSRPQGPERNRSRDLPTRQCPNPPSSTRGLRRGLPPGQGMQLRLLPAELLQPLVFHSSLIRPSTSPRHFPGACFFSRSVRQSSLKHKSESSFRAR